MLEQEAVVRAIVTDELTGLNASKLQSANGRKKLKKKILHKLEKKSDVHPKDVLLTDVAVQ